MTALDWHLIRSFVAVAEAGSLAAAAQRIGISQPSLGRHIDAMEAATGLTLFVRGRDGMRLTEAGMTLIDDARAMAADAERLALKAAGQSADPTGTVRITASQVVATCILPGIIADLVRAEPGIEIELVASNTVENLLSRDADIAVRMARPAQDDLIARKVNDMAIGAFARADYLACHGVPADWPRNWDALSSHCIVGYDRSDLIVRAMADMGISASRRDFRLRTDDQVVNWELVKAGAGIGFASVFVARQSPGMRRLWPDLPIPALPMWLASHRDLRTSLRIRRVMDFLADALTALPLNSDPGDDPTR
ncbi:LysR family transcriptional regulator [Fodinicurvata sp. EGI_FJ10296]|uniref:LysR family transcriptional regulator n=1 Tax=Fodinicurvata sp. EGI_FJ10296 TaxID=3231908 RepID=UPI003456D6FC